MIAAKVGEAVITEAELLNAAANYIPEGTYHAKVDRSDNREYRSAALNELIERELFVFEANKKGIKTSEEEVDAVVAGTIKRFGSKDAMNKALQSRGFTMEGLREMIRKGIIVNMYLKQLSSESVCSDDELRTYYDENRSKYRRPESIFLYGIMLNVEPSSPESVWLDKKKLAEELLGKIRSGEDFRLVAYNSSEDNYKYKSGEMGYIHRGRLTPQELEDAAFSLKKDEVSEVIRTIHGFHILKAGERKEGETKSFEEVKAGLKKDLERKRFEAAKKSILERLRREYPVQIYTELQGSSEK